jgi:hypothetical protein
LRKTYITAVVKIIKNCEKLRFMASPTPHPNPLPGRERELITQAH